LRGGAATRTSPVSFSLSSSFTRNWLPVLKTTRSPIKVLFGHRQCCGSGMFIQDPRSRIHPGLKDPRFFPYRIQGSKKHRILEPGSGSAPEGIGADLNVFPDG
jgi:hypothetical protein